MTTIAKLGIAFCFAGALTYAENWNGKIMDASCFDKSSQSQTATDSKSREKLAQMCAPTSSTNDFVFQTSNGKVYKLNTEGNNKAAAAFKDGALKADKDGDMHATVSGSLQGDTIKVDSVSGKHRKKTTS